MIERCRGRKGRGVERRYTYALFFPLAYMIISILATIVNPPQSTRSKQITLSIPTFHLRITIPVTPIHSTEEERREKQTGSTDQAERKSPMSFIRPHSPSSNNLIDRTDLIQLCSYRRLTKTSDPLLRRFADRCCGCGGYWCSGKSVGAGGREAGSIGDRTRRGNHGVHRQRGGEWKEML